jgi:hypothetical protein
MYIHYVLFSANSTISVTVVDWTRLASNVTEHAGFFHLHLKHGDQVETELRVTNGALNQVVMATDGFVVDLTPPLLVFLGDGPDWEADTEYQVGIWSL